MPNLNEITPMPHTNEEMREEFKKQLFCGTEEFTDEVADFWLNKISNELGETRLGTCTP